MFDFLKKMLPTVGGTSSTGQVDKTDLAKIARDTLVVMVVAGLTFLGGHVADLTSNMGELATVGATVLTAAISYALRWFKDHEPKGK